MSAPKHLRDEPERSILYDMLLPCRAPLRVELLAEADHEPALHGQPEARLRAPAARLICAFGDEIIAADSRTLPFRTGSVDCILATDGAMQAVEPFARAAFLSEAHRALAPHGVLLLDAANAFDVRGWIWGLHSGGRRTMFALRRMRGLSWGGWRKALHAAGFAEVTGYAVPIRAGDALVLVSVAAAPAAAHYADAINRARAGWGTPLRLAFRVLSRLRLMRFLEPSYLIVARK